MTSLLSASKWSILVLPILGAKGCGGGGGGGGNPSPNTSISEWMSSATSYLPDGMIEAMHHVPLINWLV